MLPLYICSVIIGAFSKRPSQISSFSLLMATYMFLSIPDYICVIVVNNYIFQFSKIIIEGEFYSPWFINGSSEQTLTYSILYKRYFSLIFTWTP